jgi:hypothetical protein
MTAQPTGHAMWSPDPVRQRLAAHTLEDVLKLPERRDRLEKPADDAAAGIPHFWRIEQDPIHVFANDLGKNGYELVAEATEELVLKAPFDIRLPIRDITP